MAILTIISAILNVISGVSALAVNPLGGIFYFILAALPLFVSFKWFKWLKEDDEDNREELVKWMRI